MTVTDGGISSPNVPHVTVGRSKVRNRGVVTNGTHFLTVVLTRVHIKHTMAHNSTVVPLFPYYEPWNV